MKCAPIYKHSHPCNYVSDQTDKLSTTTLYLELQFVDDNTYHLVVGTHRATAIGLMVEFRQARHVFHSFCYESPPCIGIVKFQ